MKIVLVFTLVVASACGSPSSPQPSPDAVRAALCDLAPIARQIPVDIRAAINAAQTRDVQGASAAAKRAVDHGTQITDSTAAAASRASPDPGFHDLTLVGLFGQQGGFLFQNADGGIPSAKSLASLTSDLPRLDPILARIHADLEAAGLGPCWSR